MSRISKTVMTPADVHHPAILRLEPKPGRRKKKKYDPSDERAKANLTPAKRTVNKHASHDQDSHGNRVGRKKVSTRKPLVVRARRTHEDKSVPFSDWSKAPALPMPPPGYAYYVGKKKLTPEHAKRAAMTGHKVAVRRISKLNTRAPLDRSPKKNWVENAGGLPMYIRRIANHLHAEKGMTIGHAIATAVNVVKKMCGSGDLNWPGAQQANAGSRAEACAAVADWERKKGMSKNLQGIRKKVYTDREYIAFLVKREFSGEQREKLATKGKALPHGGFPIVTVQDLKNAIQAIGRAKNPEATKRHIIRQAKRLGKEDLVPVGWVSKREISDREFLRLAKWVLAGDTPDTFELTGEITKTDTDQQLAFGWASLGTTKDGKVVVDKQGDMIDDPHEIEKAAYDFVLHSRDGGEMHLRKGIGTLVESFVTTPEKIEAMGIPVGTLPVGWWVGFKVHDGEVWKAIKDGKYRMFSVHGKGVRKEVTE